MDQHQKVTVYTPESGLKNPGKLFTELWQDLNGSWSLGWRLFLRNRKSMYRQSVLGLAWAFIPPIMTTLVWVFLNSQRIINIDDTGVPYPAFVLTSTLLWSVFAQTLTMPINAINSGKATIKKINFPKESLLIAGFLQIGFDFLVKLVLIIAVFIVFKIDPPMTIPLFPLGVAMMVLLGMAIGLLVLPVGLLYTDVSRFLTAITPFWMLLTPVIYPAPREGIATLLNKFNPVSPLITVTRDWMLYGQTDFLHSFLIISGISLLLFVLGMVLFRLAIPFIIERSGG